ncbi:uncharacterized, partial [Tachysurus ichikawai]
IQHHDRVGIGSPAQKCSRPNNQRQWAAVPLCAVDARLSCQRLECVLSSFLSLSSVMWFSFESIQSHMLSDPTDSSDHFVYIKNRDEAQKPLGLCIKRKHSKTRLSTWMQKDEV